MDTNFMPAVATGTNVAGRRSPLLSPRQWRMLGYTAAAAGYAAFCAIALFPLLFAF
jgi:hypothetical protein